MFVSRLGVLAVLSCALAVACDDPVCPSEVFVAIQTSQVVVDSDAVAPGIQTSVRVRTSLDEGEQVTLEIFSGFDAPLGTATAAWGGAPPAVVAARDYWFTGDFGSSSRAIRSRTWSALSTPAWPMRGMLEQAL